MERRRSAAYASSAYYQLSTQRYFTRAPSPKTMRMRLIAFSQILRKIDRTLVFTQHSSHFTCANAVSGPSSIQSPAVKGSKRRQC